MTQCRRYFGSGHSPQAWLTNLPSSADLGNAGDRDHEHLSSPLVRSAMTRRQFMLHIEELSSDGFDACCRLRIPEIDTRTLESRAISTRGPAHLSPKPNALRSLRYAELLGQSENVAAHAGASRYAAGTVDVVIARSFTGLATATQVCRRPILDRFRDFKSPSGTRYGIRRCAPCIGTTLARGLKA